jgi:hypothetical protein
MKKVLFISLIVSTILLLFNRCNKESLKPGNGKIEFGFSAESSQLKSGSLNAIKSIVVSVAEKNGNLIYDKETIELTNFNGEFLSKPISLKPGEYKLVQFHVVDLNGNVLFSAPFEGSKKAYLVLDPLPIEFIINKDEVLKISPEVLSVENCNASDFGYTTFTFNVVKTFDFLISVFIYNPIIKNYELTTASIKITGKEPSVYSGSLEALTNKVTIRDGSTNYQIEISKPFFETYKADISVELLKTYINNPLKVILDKSESIPGLMAQYPFNGNPNDASGQNKNGIDYGTASYALGKFSDSRLFDNDPTVGVPSRNYTTIPNVINSTEFSINFWANFSWSGNHQSLIYLSTIDDWTKANFWLEVSVDMKLAVILNGLDLRAIDYSHQSLLNGQYHNSYINSKSLELNRYYNITCTFKNSVLILYVDGVEYAKYLNVNRVVGNPDAQILLGVCPKPSMLYYPMIGKMDELSFYNRAITLEEINMLYKRQN